MKRWREPLPFLLSITAFILFLFLVMQPVFVVAFQDFLDVLFPDGEIAIQQRNLLLLLQLLMLLVIIPVYILTFVFSWRYRAGNDKARYDPDLVDHKLAEYIWWGVPSVMTLMIALLTVVKTYELDPYRPIASEEKPMTVQVVALQWRWLFIYPEEGIASVNFLQFPSQRPIHFEITADAPMNSFWIPALGGQIYAMPGMKTQLHLIADEPGDFRGSSANLSGAGFANMHFMARASSQEEYEAWVASMKRSDQQLDEKSYQQLSEPNEDSHVLAYQLASHDLFHQILMKYMMPQKAAEPENVLSQQLIQPLISPL